MRSKRQVDDEERYDASFYDAINAGSERSAKIVVPRVLEVIKDAGIPVEGVVDVGCGEGVWAAEFARAVDHVTGIDGPHVDPTRVQIDDFLAIDLAIERAQVAQRFDLAVSLEVAEHLPPARAHLFVEDLCTLADVILFSAAIPGQGGTNHINEQWPAYWAEHFDQRGYVMSGALRWMFWDNPVVEPWYCQNLMLVVKAPLVEKFEESLFFGPHSLPLPAVHPVIWDWRRVKP